MKKVTIPLLFLFAMLTLSGFGQFQEYVIHEVANKQFVYVLPSGDSILLNAGNSFVYKEDSMKSLFPMNNLIGGFQMYFNDKDSITEVFHNNKFTYQDVNFEFGSAYNPLELEYFTSGSYQGRFNAKSFVLFEDSLFVSVNEKEFDEKTKGLYLWKAIDEDEAELLDTCYHQGEKYFYIPQLWKTSDTTAVVLFDDEIGSITIYDNQLNYKKWTEFDMDEQLLSDYTPGGQGITFLANQNLYQVNHNTESVDTLIQQLQGSIVEYYYDGDMLYSIIQNENEELRLISDSGNGEFTVLLDYHQSQPTNLVSDLHLIVIDSKIYLSGLTEIGDSPFLTIGEFFDQYEENRAQLTIEEATCIDTGQFWQACEMTITNTGNVPIYSFDLYHSFSGAFFFGDYNILSFKDDTFLPGESITTEFKGGKSGLKLYVEAANHLFLEEPEFFTDFIIATDEIEYPKIISLYPNPVINELIVELEDDFVSKIMEISILDAKGSHIKSFTTQNRKQLMIDVSDLVSGTYWLQINDGNREFRVEKFIKQ